MLFISKPGRRIHHHVATGIEFLARFVDVSRKYFG
jgi:hypothetical protein